MFQPRCMSIVTSIVLLICASMALAATVPLDWDTNPYYTYQSWSFTTGLPAEPDPCFISPGSPAMTLSPEVSWDSSGRAILYGGAPVGGPEASWTTRGVIMSIYVPNQPVPELQKEIWMSAVLQATPGIIPFLTVGVYDENDLPADVISYDIIPIDEPSGIFEIVATLAFDHQPPYEYVDFDVINDFEPIGGNEVAILDYITVATRCVPEPTTLALVALGSIALIRKRRK